MEWIVQPARGLSGIVRIPADRSVACQAAMISSIAEGITTIEGAETWFRTAFDADESASPPLRAIGSLGVPIREIKGKLVVHGQGLRGLRQPSQILEAGDSTTLQLLTGLLAGQSFESTVGGDALLGQYPMGAITQPLRRMGVHITGVVDPSIGDDEYPPLTLCGGSLKGIRHEMPGANTPIKAAILLAGLYADGPTTVVEPLPSVDHTERMLSVFGAKVKRKTRRPAEVEDSTPNTTSVEMDISAELQWRLRRLEGEAEEKEVMETTLLSDPGLKGQHVILPGDLSLSASFLVAGIIIPRSEIRIERVSLNPTRRGIIEVLRRMGAEIQVENEEEGTGEPFGDVIVQSSDLNRIRIAGSLTHRVMNEIPILAVAATQVEGEIIVRDARELRSFHLPRLGKEIDRIQVIVGNLRKMGARIGEMPDGFIIEGGHPLIGTRVRSFGDPWMAMAFAVAGLAAEGETIVEDIECTDGIFPEFYHQLDTLRRR